ncbi:hypothetical protein [Mycolicibacterium nivoides]|uniref:Scaffolding protein n=1 Tax=Mycolicibacterium nivoides TaxID=2487344 RepID=A0ABW9LB94_9MYCO
MSENGDLPIHPTTGLRAIGIGKRGPWWPVMGASEDHGAADSDAGGGDDNPGDDTGTESDTATGSQDGGDGAPKPTETVEFWRDKARDWETRSKANAKAADQLTEANNRATAAEAEVASVPAKVAEALKSHLVARHQIAEEDAELFLTATDPELLLKQVDRFLGQPDKRRKNSNYVANQGNGKTDDDGNGLDRQFVRDLFGNNN